MEATDTIAGTLGQPTSHMVSDALVMSRWVNTQPEVDVTVAGGLCVMLLLSSTQTVEMRRGGRPGIARARVGLVNIPNPMLETTATVRGGSDTLYLTFPDSSPSPEVPYRFIEVEPTISRLATRAAAMLSAGYNDPLALVELRLCFDEALVERGVTPIARGGLSRAQLRRAMELIDAAVSSGIARSPSLAELADAAGVSKFHFAHQFRHSTGESPYGYSLRRRIERARTMLLETEELASTIGYRCGFASPAHFVQRYREVIGVSPSRYRAIVRG